MNEKSQMLGHVRAGVIQLAAAVNAANLMLEDEEVMLSVRDHEELTRLIKEGRAAFSSLAKTADLFGNVVRERRAITTTHN